MENTINFISALLVFVGAVTVFVGVVAAGVLLSDCRQIIKEKRKHGI
jgi:hypothetical protein